MGRRRGIGLRQVAGVCGTGVGGPQIQPGGLQRCRSQGRASRALP